MRQPECEMSEPTASHRNSPAIAEIRRTEKQVTHNPWSIASDFTWSPDGKNLAFVRRVTDSSQSANQIFVAILENLRSR